MTLTRISAAEAARLLVDEGYVYLDVRSAQEFELGHPAGAYNVPLQVMQAHGLQANADFMRVVTAMFARDSKLVVGCHTGSRSVRAAQQLMAAGFTQVVEQRAGYAGSRDAFGRLLEAGWEALGLPSELQAQAGRGYEELRSKQSRE